MGSKIRQRFSHWRHRLPLRNRAPRRRRIRRHRVPPRKAKVILIAAGIALLILLINHYAANHIRPIMAEMARVRVNRLASQVINQAITEKISGISYNDLVVFEKDIYGQITALKTDTVTVNRFRSEIAAAVLNALEKADTSGIAIPVGNLINGDLFGGRGPRIPLKIVPLGTVSAQLGNQFNDAGINQTRHQIMMDVAVSITVLLPGYNVDTEVTAQVSVAETVIVGEVPDSYWTGTLPPAA